MKIINKYYFSFFLGIVFIIALNSCADEFDKFTPFDSVEKIESILNTENDFNSEFFNNEAGVKITTDHFTIITIPEDAFDLSGVGGSGQIEFRYIEIYTKGDKIKYNVPTISDGRLIASDGVFYFEALMDGVKIQLQPGKQIRVEMFNSNPDSKMELFYGDTDQQDRFNWTEADGDPDATGGVLIIEQQDSSGEVRVGYEFFTDSLTWINVDVFVDIPKDDRTAVCVELPESYNHENTSVYMVFQDYNSVVTLHTVPGSSKFCEPYGGTPIGASVTFVVISKQGEEIYHFALEDAVITANYVTDMFPTETSMADITNALDNL